MMVGAFSYNNNSSWCMLGLWCILSHVILSIFLRARYSYFHIIDDETNVSTLVKVTQLVTDRDNFQCQVFLLFTTLQNAVGLPELLLYFLPRCHHYFSGSQFTTDRNACWTPFYPLLIRLSSWNSTALLFLWP